MTSVRRVVLLGPSPPDRGGIARETALLARELAPRTSLTYLTFSRPYPRWLDPRRFDHSPDAPPSPSEGRPILDYRSPSSWRKTALAIASQEPDALIAPWWTSFWGVPLRAVMRHVARLAPGTARVLLCHNVEEHETTHLRRFLAQGAFLAADAFVVHGAEDARRLAARAPGRAIAVLPHPVVPSALPDRARARRDLGIEGPLVLFLGLVRRYKGVDLLLDAAPALVRGSGARIAVVGEVFPEARALERRWKASPVRESILWRDEYVSEEEMARWLAACDVVVLPYRYVSGSGIAARAIAARRPLAAAAVGGLAEIVEPGVTGELFPAGDTAALAAAVRCVLERGPGHYEEGLARAAEQSSWPRYVDALISHVSSLSARKPGSR
jgi:D-inositol-3-phosphate glycosyltransferase